MNDRFQSYCKTLKERKGPPLAKFKHLNRILKFYDKYMKALIDYDRELTEFFSKTQAIFDPKLFTSFQEICQIIKNFEIDLNEFDQLYPLVRQ